MPHHIKAGKFQSDMFPGCPAGMVPLSTSSKRAQDLLWELAQRHREEDPEFAEDLEFALRVQGYSDETRYRHTNHDKPCPTCGTRWDCEQEQPDRNEEKGVTTEIGVASIKDDLLEVALGIIANAYGGDWEAAAPTWKRAAANWRDRYHAILHPSVNPSEKFPIERTSQNRRRGDRRQYSERRMMGSEQRREERREKPDG